MRPGRRRCPTLLARRAGWEVLEELVRGFLGLAPVFALAGDFVLSGPSPDAVLRPRIDEVHDELPSGIVADATVDQPW
jgi:hypothetical protein